MSRLPIRLRLTLAFAAALALLLGGAGLLLYVQLARSLDHTIARSLRARAADVAALVAQADTGLREAPPGAFAGAGGDFAQILDAHGRVLDETPGLGRTPLITREQRAAVHGRPALVQRAEHGSEPVRLLVLPVRAQDQRLLVVIGTSLRSRDSALASLRGELLVGSPLALLLVSLVGYAFAAGALRPVERMRARAEALSEAHLHEQLPVPPARDELSRLGATLNDLLARVRAALDRERSFVADASHELRTPLTHLRTEIEHTLDRPRANEELVGVLRSAAAEVDRLSHLAEGLLLLARLDRGKLRIRTAPVALADMCEGLAARFRQRARATGRRIVVDVDGHVVEVDRLRMEQALANLVENALRHGSGDVRVFTAETADSLELHVTDSGPGFPREFLSRAFERFSRADEPRTEPGAGLGLAIAAEIAAAHGGAARAANRPEGGADVWLAIPVVRSSPAAP
jgi:two-component system OmpR family sensor kinase